MFLISNIDFVLVLAYLQGMQLMKIIERSVVLFKLM